MAKYEVSKETASFIDYIKRVGELDSSIRDTLEEIYCNENIIKRGEVNVEKLGSRLFGALGVVRDELYSFLNDNIAENLFTPNNANLI
jgi:hypothetical protein